MLAEARERSKLRDLREQECALTSSTASSSFGVTRGDDAPGASSALGAASLRGIPNAVISAAKFQGQKMDSLPAMLSDSVRESYRLAAIAAEDIEMQMRTIIERAEREGKSQRVLEHLRSRHDEAVEHAASLARHLAQMNLQVLEGQLETGTSDTQWRERSSQSLKGRAKSALTR